MRRYGLPYKGSKNSIAEFIVESIPSRTHFYDLFAGGGAVSHCVMLSGKFHTFHMNDIEDTPLLFLESVHGRYHYENRWISREDFYRLKDSEPYIRYCWSFGNNGKNYLYSKEIEPWKKALHYARVYGDYSLLKEFGIYTNDASRVFISKNQKSYKQKYILWYCHEILHSDLDVLELQRNLKKRIEKNSEELRAYLLEGMRKAGKRPCDVDRFLGTNGMAGHYFGKSQWEFPTREVYIQLQSFLYLPLDYEKIYGLQELLESLQRLQSLQSLESLQSLQRLERLQSLESLQSLQRLERLSISQKSYDEVRILPDSVIYCDIPYRGTDEYISGQFDYEKFYAWCEKQKELVVISEYDMPEDRFCCVESVQKRSLLSAKGAGELKTEKLFVPKHQIEMWLRLKGKYFNSFENQ